LVDTDMDRITMATPFMVFLDEGNKATILIRHENA
jgi:hypothetical protein